MNNPTRSGSRPFRGGSTRPRTGSPSRAAAGSKRHAAPQRRGSAPRKNDSVTLPVIGKSLSRRQFFAGIAGVAALAAVGVGTSYASSKSEEDADMSTLTVPESAVISTDDLEEIKNPEEVISCSASVQLPYGTLVWSNDDKLAICMIPTGQARPLVHVGTLSLTSGNVTTVLKRAVGEKDGFEIYDARGNSNGLIWVEADILDGVWRVWNARLRKGELDDPQMLDEGDMNWEMPSLAAADAYGYWQCLPQLNGEARTENSLLKRARFGTADAEVVYESPGRMTSPPTSTGKGIVITPRAASDGTNYQLTYLDGATAEPLDACVLPASMKPLEAGYGKTGFNFAFDAIYNYGEGIANLGTYMPLSMPDKPALDQSNASEGEEGQPQSGLTLSVAAVNPLTQAYSDCKWFHYARVPSSPPAWLRSWVLVKSASGSICGIDLDEKRYFLISPKSGADNYGELLASTNMGKRAVTYSNIDYTSLTGDADQKCCLVRIWEVN